MKNFTLILSLLTLLLGCGSTPSYYKGTNSETKETQVKQEKQKPQKSKFSITVKATPNDARVRILNIKPKYIDGILVNSGKYHIEVSKSGFLTYKKWINVRDDLVHEVSLKKKIDKSKEYIAFLKSVKSGIPVLPLSSLHNRKFKQYLLCKFESPEKSIEPLLNKLDKQFKSTDFDNGFDRRRASIALEEKKQDEISKAAQSCRDQINAPVFVSDSYLPVDDEISGSYATVSFIFYEVEIKGKRYDFGSPGMGAFREEFTFSDTWPKVQIDNDSNNFTSNGRLKMSIKEKEDLYLSLPKYAGKNRHLKSDKELKGKVYFSLGAGNRYSIFRMYPEYYEFGEYKGKMKTYKRERRVDVDYANRASYVFF